jgi:hypothetical protein
MGPLRCRNRFRGRIAATALIALAAGSTHTVARLSSAHTFAASNTPTTGNWTGNASGNAEDLVTNGQSDSPVFPYVATSYNRSGLVPGTYLCFAAAPSNLAGYSGRSPWACATKPVPVATALTAIASNPTTVTLKWTDNTGLTARYLVTDGAGNYSPALSAGTSRHAWLTGLTSNMRKCLAVLAEGANANSGWSQRACATTSWSETDARNDLLKHLAAIPLAVRNSLHDSAGNTMDTAKVIQMSPGSYLAVYATGDVIKLATSTNLVSWLYVTNLDTSATQPYIAQGPNGSYILADEKYDSNGVASGSSHLYFIHYSNLNALLAGQSDWFAIPPSNLSLLGDRFYSPCNEGTPDIHGISPVGQRGFVAVNFGFHYNSHCGVAGSDREAFGTFQVTSLTSPTGRATASWFTRNDTPRDNAVASIGYTGSRGGRDDITWHNWRFSIQEAQCGSQIVADCAIGNAAYDYTSWRYVLYDYSNQQAYPVAIPTSVETVNGATAMCHGNPKAAVVNNPDLRPVLVVTGFIFGPPGGCVSAGTIAGEFLYVVPVS